MNAADGNPHNIPMSTHQVGLIQTSQELVEIQEANIRKSHQRQRSSLKLSRKKSGKAKKLGLGSRSYMHAYRTGAFPQNNMMDENIGDAIRGTIEHSAPPPTNSSYKNLPIPTPKSKKQVGYMSENDAQQTDRDMATDLDFDDTDIDNVQQEIETRPVSKSLTMPARDSKLADRRKKFANSRHQRNPSATLQRDRNSNKARRDVNKLLKVDYKATNKETYATSLDRMQTFVNDDKKKELTRYIEEYQRGGKGLALHDHHSTQLVDDLTFGDLPFNTLHGTTRDDHGKEEKKKNMTAELRRRAHKAKKKRWNNEVLARRAILIASEIPDYMRWVDKPGQWAMVKKINALVISNMFRNFIMLIIVANTVVLALTWPQQDPKLRRSLEIVNTVFTYIFLLEAILKLIGLGRKSYFRDNWNKFDFIIVVVSIIELTLSSEGGSPVAALRSMRLLRAFRLLGKFDTLRQLFMLVVQSMHEVSLLTMVLGIFIFMFAALAMSLFGGKLIDLGDRRTGRWRFDNFYWSWVNVFMVISGDSWNEVMYDTVKATGNRTTVIYYVVVVCFGTFVILNLFVAILLSRMGSDESDEEFMLDGLTKYSRKMIDEGQEDGFDDEYNREMVDRLVMSIERKKYVAQFKDKRSKWKHHREKKKIEGTSLGIFDPDNKFRKFCHSIVHWAWFEISIDILILINCVFLALESPKAREGSADMFFVADIFFTVMFVLEFILKVIALGAFKQPFRAKRTWKKITDDDELIQWTDQSYQAVFFMHTLNDKILDLPGLAIECIKSNDGYHIVHLWGKQVLRIVYLDNAFETCYKLHNQDEGEWKLWNPKAKPPEDKELLTVLTSFDLTDNHHNAYFASNWNRLDAFVVLVAVLGVGFEDVAFLRALRAFRPFRIMVRFKKIKVVLGALLRAIPGLFNVFLFCILFWFVLSILGVNWYNGLYRHCRIDDEVIYSTPNSTVGWVGCEQFVDNVTMTSCDDACSDSCIMYSFGKTECDSLPGLVWTISVFNFDNVFQALHTLFVVATLSGWNFVMYEAIDSTKFNQPLIEDNKPEAAVYFMVVVILCSFFSLNLIVSVVVDNFNKIKAEKDGSAFQTEEQALWVNNQRLLERISLAPTFSSPNNIFRRWAFQIVEHTLFDPFIMGCIIANAVTMAMEHYDQNKTWTQFLSIADKFFVVIFVLEAVLKIAGYGFKLYILSNWNKFDFVISIVGVVGLATDASVGLNVLRLFRVGRLLRLLHKAKTLKMLFWTLVYSIPSLWNIGLLLFVIFFIYAVVGMHILTDYVTEVHEEVNAETFWSAISLLYRVGTEDGWTDVYQSYLEAWPRDERYKIYAYFISFFILGTLVLINLFIAVVLDSFEENRESFSREDKFITIQIWRDIWSYFDPDAKRELPVRDFIEILKLTPKSEEFFDKHKITGPGFHEGNPFETLYKRVDTLMRTRSSSRSKSHKSWLSRRPSSGPNMGSLALKRTASNATDISESDGNQDNFFTSSTSIVSGSYITRKLQAMYDVKERKEQLRQLCPNVSHADMIKLLLRLRLVVVRHDDQNQSGLDCFGRIAKLIVDICTSMGIGSAQQGDDLLRSHTKRSQSDLKGAIGSKSKSPKSSDGGGGYRSDTEDEERISSAIADRDFDRGDKTWYVSYDECLLAICSELIGPRLPDGYPMFDIEHHHNHDEEDGSGGHRQLRIAEWYAIKNACDDIYRAVILSIEQNKQYSEFLPSQHVSDERQKSMQEKVKSKKFQLEYKKLIEELKQNNGLSSDDMDDDDDDDDDDDNNINVKSQRRQPRIKHINPQIEVDIYIGNESKQEEQEENKNTNNYTTTTDQLEDILSGVILEDDEKDDTKKVPQVPLLPKPSESTHSKRAQLSSVRGTAIHHTQSSSMNHQIVYPEEDELDPTDDMRILHENDDDDDDDDDHNDNAEENNNDDDNDNENNDNIKNDSKPQQQDNDKET